MSDLYIFGVPGYVGGASTKIIHLIYLLNGLFSISLILPSKEWSKNKEVKKLIKLLNIKSYVANQWSPKNNDIVLAVCVSDFFTSGVALRMKNNGAKIIWANEMMWPFEGEKKAVESGLIDKVVYVSEAQKLSLRSIHACLPYTMVGNYISPKEYAFRHRKNSVFTIGRLSRPDPMKYPEDFPLFYSRLGIVDIQYRVMAWDSNVNKKYPWFNFNDQWNLLKPNQENAVEFLHTLDLFVYPIGHRVKESWGRSTVEAMLTGCVPIVPSGHQFSLFIENGVTGYICQEYEEWKYHIQKLYTDNGHKEKMASATARYAREEICNDVEHAKIWCDALSI